MKTMTKYGDGNTLFSNNKGWREDIAPAFIVILQGFGPWTHALEGLALTLLSNGAKPRAEVRGFLWGEWANVWLYFFQ